VDVKAKWELAMDDEFMVSHKKIKHEIWLNWQTSEPCIISGSIG